MRTSPRQTASAFQEKEKERFPFSPGAVVCLAASGGSIVTFWVDSFDLFKCLGLIRLYRIFKKKLNLRKFNLFKFT